MKKLLIGLLFLVGCAPASSVDMSECDSGCEVISGQDTTDDALELNVSTIDEAYKTIANDGTGLYFFYADKCHWCHSAMPVIAEVSKLYPDVVVYYIDVQKTTSNDNSSEFITTKDVQNLLNTVSQEDIVIKTPSFVFLKDGIAVDYISGVPSANGEDINEEKFINTLKEGFELLK